MVSGPLTVFKCSHRMISIYVRRIPLVVNITSYGSPKNGAICRGPEGPERTWGTGYPAYRTLSGENVPSSVEVLEKDLYIHYLAHLPIDRKVDQESLGMFCMFSFELYRFLHFN
ncbi:hypothetical protein L218DRAFT_1163 [Marasmius fiardii PR-910]|nr:hypothetical protein L218DRAFT_1163 [Marasmius fiardii PR-910]